MIQISTDNGGSWTELDRFAGPTNDGAFQSTAYDITSYMSATTRIRLISSPTMGNFDQVYFDNIQVAVTGALTCPGTDHFVINHNGVGINCLAEPMSVTAALSDGTTDTTYTGTVTLDTQSGTGTWTLASGNGVFNDATADDGLATYTFDALDAGVANFELDYQSGVSTIDVDAYDGTIRDDDSEGNLVFYSSGYTVTEAPLSNPPGVIDTTITPRTAATDFTLYLAAYGQTPSDPTCGIIESYDGPQNVNFWSTYVDPGTGTLSMTVDGNTISTTEGGSVSQLVNFTSGQGSITVNYPDAGMMNLGMKDITTTNPELPNGVIGASLRRMWRS